MHARPLPAYELLGVKHALTLGRYALTFEVRSSLGVLKMDEDDVVDCIQGLTSGSFYKTIPNSTYFSGAAQDVYRPTYSGSVLYVKFFMDGAGCLVVTSFKKK